MGQRRDEAKNSDGSPRYHPSLDAVEVHEHGGWYLTFLRDGTIVGTANDQAHLDNKAIQFLDSIYGYESADEIRRP